MDGIRKDYAERGSLDVTYSLSSQSPAPNVNIQHVDQERIKGQGGKIAGTDETGDRGEGSSWGGQKRRRGTNNNRAV